MRWVDRAHFFAVSAQLMRRILIDNARRHNLTRGAGSGERRPPSRPACPRRYAQVSGGVGPPKSPDRRASLLWRTNGRRDRLCPEGLDDHRDTKLEHCQSMAVP
jgi:hypothetical protein